MKRVLSVLLLTILVVLMVPPYVMAGDDGSVKIGDKLILKGGFEAVCVGYDNGGRPQYQADFSAPKYLEDLVTKVDTEWHSDSHGYSSGANLFDSYVTDEFVNVSDKGKSLSWQPEVTIKNLDKVKSKNVVEGLQIAKQVKARLLDVDPLNPNYKKNTLEWDYGNGILRRLRIIEGVQQEYYVITSKIEGDIEIKSNVNKNGLQPGKAVAWDADKKVVEVTEDTSHNLKLTKDKSKDAKYPIIIDPDVTFTTSSSDGFIWWYNAVYATARTSATGNVTNSTHPSFYYVLQVGGLYVIFRNYFYFDTSALGAFVVTAAVLKVYVFGTILNVDTQTIQIQSGMPTYPHPSMEAGDYDLTNYAGNGGSKAFSTFTGGQYNDIALNAGGLAMINPAGVTKLCLRATGDINNIAPTGMNSMQYGSYEDGVGYRPQLVVTFTSTAPVIISVAASNVSTAGARLNSNLTNDGSGAMLIEDCDIRFGYCSTATLANGTGTATGAPISLLPSGVTNTVVATGAGTFTITLPAGHTGQAVSGTATLTVSPTNLVAGANAVDTGATTGNFTVTIILSSFANYANLQNPWDNNLGNYYHTGAVPCYDVLGLTIGTQYYFAVQARNTVGTTTSPIERYFTTLTSVADMTQFVAIPNTTSISLSWVKSSGANRTRIWCRTDGAYPTSETGADGSTEVYFNTASNYLHTGLTEGVTYFYSAWGETLGTYSANEINLVMTTDAGISASDLPSLVAPTGGWFVNPDGTFLVNFQPWYSVINGLADSWGMPRANAWFLMVILVVLIVGIGSYILFHAPALSLIVMVLMIMGGVVIHILSPYMIVLAGLMALGAWSTRPQGV